MNFSGKNLEKNSGKKNFLIHIITRKIPRGVLATRVCLARTPRNKSRNNFEENFNKKIWKKNWKKISKKICKKKIWKKIWKKVWKKILRKNFRKILTKIWKKNWKKNLEKFMTNHEYFRNNSWNSWIIHEFFRKKSWKIFLEKKFSHSYNHEKNPAWGARNTRVSRANPSK